MKLEAHSFAQSAAVLHDPETASDVATIHPTGDPEKTRDLSSRLAACWNACHGLEIPVNVSPGALADLISAAMRMCAGITGNNVRCPVIGDCEYYHGIEHDGAEEFRAALAKLNPVSEPTVTVAFVAQKWVGDYADEVEPWGDHTWEIPLSEFLEIFPDAESLATNYEDRDGLRLHDNAPKWVQEWDGPFEVVLEDESQTPWG
jgi:hypothetical protein